MNHNILRTTLLSSLVLLYSCNKEDDLAKKTEIQSGKEIEAQNRNLEKVSNSLEKELNRRWNLVSAVNGVYRGRIKVQEQVFELKFILTPTLSTPDPDRVRLPEELMYELQNLNLNAQVIQWAPDIDMTATGCIFKNVQPDIKRGTINFFSEACPNSYRLYLVNTNVITEEEADRGSPEVVRQAMSGEISEVPILFGVIQPNNSSKSISFEVNRGGK